MGLAHGFNISSDVKEIAKELKEGYKLTDFEALTLALKAEQNELLKRAFVISSTDAHPTGLEAIATALGYKNR
ncbi:histidine kinase [Chitinophaga agri]|uniref:Histidine kinase n=1 Tax=Chitinophaga agri TaxID=2703787 RepID=A0A6B9ZBY5_9BACT|nr:histidine kinase [Chitinophaga agri]QHS59850.1 histidine kinase [Chitinophaga agri]